ncbi:hypothetical protein Cgig2_015728 [Carnegiea gigantea]|uniref:DUF4283 domain-containing protein n=1 Tax=Carnegiea gigantea TaxID=171969 RepID=A0A9Q1GVJ2_9CARY|nr:hypothetical protein Cgig2_015728 [Carnegiea gigantea]
MVKGTRGRRPPTESVQKALELNRIQSEAHLYCRGTLSEGSRFSIAEESSRIFEEECMIDWENENKDQDRAKKGNEKEVVSVQQVQTESLAPREGETLMFTGSDGKSKIAITDIQEELDFWQFSVLASVLGMNPPLKVIDVWEKFEFESVVIVQKGLFLIHFTSKADRRRALESGTIFLDKHPVVVKKWNLETSMSKEEVRIVDVWVRLPGLHVKYWSTMSLSKIMSQIGIPKQTNHYTPRRIRLAYVRVLVEIQTNQELKEEVIFENEKGTEVRQPIHFEWKPLKCSSCGMFGHSEDNSNRMPRIIQRWVRKENAQQSIARLDKHEEQQQHNQDQNVHESPVCILEMSVQHIHSYIRHITRKCLYLTLVYGANEDEERVALWDTLRR